MSAIDNILYTRKRINKYSHKIYGHDMKFNTKYHQNCSSFSATSTVYIIHIKYIQHKTKSTKYKFNKQTSKKQQCDNQTIKIIQFIIITNQQLKNHQFTMHDYTFPDYSIPSKYNSTVKSICYTLLNSTEFYNSTINIFTNQYSPIPQ